MRDEESARHTPDGEAHRPAHEPAGRSSAPQSKAQIIAERLRAARIAARMTQQELAGQMFSKSYISAVERGKMIPSLQALGVLANRLEVSISYLLGDGELYPLSLAAKRAAADILPERERAARQVDIMLALGKAEELIRQDQYDEALQALGQNEEPPADLPVRQEPIWYWLVGWALIMKGKHQDGVELLERGLRLAEWLHSHALPAHRATQAELVERLRCYIGIAYCWQGKTRLALECHRQGLKAIMAGLISDADLKLMIYKGLGNETLALGKYSEAVNYYQHAVNQARDSNNPRQQGLAYWGLAVAYQQQGDLLKAKMSYQGALQTLQAHGNLQLVAQIRALLGLLLVDLREYEEAEDQLRLSLWAARQQNDFRSCGMALAYFASLHNARGEPERAIQAAEEALPLARQSKDSRTEGHLLLALASAYAARRDYATAEQSYRETIRVAEQAPDFEYLSNARELYADFLAEQQRYQEAFAEIQLVVSARARGEA